MKKFVIVTALWLSAAFATVALTLGITAYSSSYTREYVATGTCSCWYESAWMYQEGHVITFKPGPGYTWAGGEVGPMVIPESGGRYWPEDARNACVTEHAQAEAFAAAFKWMVLILFTWFCAGIILLSTTPEGHRPA